MDGRGQIIKEIDAFADAPRTHEADDATSRATILLASLDFVTKAPKTMKLNTLKDLYIHELKDLYSAEKQIIKALPKMIKAATNQELASGFQEHLEQTRGHAERLEKILAGYNQGTRGPKCKGMEGLLAEGSELMEDETDHEVCDAGLIAAAKRVEHYEISGYGTARTYASLLGDKDGAKLLQTTLDEEAETDKKLTSLATSSINVAADK